MELEQKIKKREVSLAIIGLGNVGLNLLLNSAPFCQKVIGIDINQDRINQLQNGKSYLNYVSDEAILSVQNTTFTTDYSRLQEVDIVCYCLPTSSMSNKPNTDTFENALKKSLLFIKHNSLLISESTLPVGFHSKFIIPLLGQHFRLGENIFLGYAPERINPGKQPEYSQSNAQIFTGFCEHSKKNTRFFYQNFISNLHEMSCFEATEFTKIFENTYRALNIAFVDETKDIAEKLNLNIYEIIKGANSKGMSFEAHYPSSGIGGACIPMSLDYFLDAASQGHQDANLALRARKQNENKIEQIFQALKDYKNILILGAAYKKNIADLTASSTLKILEKLKETSIKTTLCDPFFDKKDFQSFNLHFIKSLDHINLKQYDATLLMVDHSEFDLLKIKKESKNVIDPKGIFLSLKI